MNQFWKTIFLLKSPKIETLFLCLWTKNCLFLFSRKWKSSIYWLSGEIEMAVERIKIYKMLIYFRKVILQIIYTKNLFLNIKQKIDVKRILLGCFSFFPRIYIYCFAENKKLIFLQENAYCIGSKPEKTKSRNVLNSFFLSSFSSIGYIPSNYVKEKELLGLQKYE